MYEWLTTTPNWRGVQRIRFSETTVPATLSSWMDKPAWLVPGESLFRKLSGPHPPFSSTLTRIPWGSGTLPGLGLFYRKCLCRKDLLVSRTRANVVSGRFYGRLLLHPLQ